MCILLIYNGINDAESDYSYIVASNRDEFYDRPAQNFAPWIEDSKVYGGRDLEAGCEGGTWLAVSPVRKKIGVLLNLPGVKKDNAKSRGEIVANFVKCEEPINVYIKNMKDYFHQCNEFVLVTADLSKPPVTYTYTNATNRFAVWTEACLGFGNSLPEYPLKKVEAAKSKMRDICTRINKIEQKAELTKELINMLKSKEQHLPDMQLERRQPDMYRQLSSIFVEVPQGKYGTRTHTVILVTKAGSVSVTEITLQTPINSSNPSWSKAEFQFDI